MTEFLAMLGDPLMQRALLVALLVGACGPVVGTYLVQRKLSLIGDGIGHIALTGVALGWLVGSWLHVSPSDLLAIPGAVAAAVIGSVLIEVVRRRGKTSGDLALALMFYGGIAGGVLIIGIAGGTSGNLMSYLFGSLTAVTWRDVITTAILCGVILLIGLGLRASLFAVSNDEDFAIASGMPVWLLNVAVAILAALTVTMAMRVVGLLLVSALMIVPVAIAQLLTHSFGRTMAIASVIGVVVCLTGLIITYWYNVSPGATIVVISIGVYLLAALIHPLLYHRAWGDREPIHIGDDHDHEPIIDPTCIPVASSSAAPHAGSFDRLNHPEIA
ncbi:MAG: metal ABC transporter permease [Promicromonosporaceae bacterium]|nr:metal ABC transporter permease [Promicromonosporaceae bacterium]